MRDSILKSENWRFWTLVTFTTFAVIGLLMIRVDNVAAAILVALSACTYILGVVGWILTGNRERRIRQERNEQ